MLSIENLTRTEKLRMMEVIWDDLSRDSETLSSPEWHAQALKEVPPRRCTVEVRFIGNCNA